MIIAIEHLQLSELVAFLREQADEAFPDLKDEQRLNMLSEKWHKYAEFCTCRDDNGIIIGMIAFYANRAEEKVVYVPHVFVTSTYRRKGLFMHMMALVEHIGIMRGFHKIQLEVAHDNSIAIKSYQKFGFVNHRETISSILMEKRLL
jgi:ribosomal protein S18 acetylase RimI-like enzyme